MNYPHEAGFKAQSTAREAAAGIEPKAKSLRARIYDVLRAGPATPEDVARALGEPVHNCRPRFSELLARDMIEDSGERGTAMGGRACIAWKVKNVQNNG